MEILLSISAGAVLGILSSFFGSYLFLKQIILKKYVPIIAISKHISKQRIGDEDNAYIFKCVNNTGREIYDVKVELSLIIPVNDKVDKNRRVKDIQLIDGCKMKVNKFDKNDEFNLHAIQVYTLDNIEEKWKIGGPSSSILVSVSAIDSVSGLQRVFEEEIPNKSWITEKKFISGSSLEVE